MNLRPRFSLKRLLRHGRAEVRRSLQARTVALTVILTLAVAIVFSGVSMVSVRASLLTQITSQSRADYSNMVQQAQTSLDAADVSATVQIQQLVNDLASSLQSEGPSNLIGVYLWSRDTNSRAIIPVSTEPSYQSLISDDIRSSVASDLDDSVFYQPVEIPGDSGMPGSGTPAAVLGTVLDFGVAGNLEFFAIYSYTFQQQSLTQIQLSLVVICALLSIVVGVVIWLVIRGIVRPIERVAAASETLASGNLDMRVTVDRKDELGVLQQSFNTMADALNQKIDELEAAGYKFSCFLADSIFSSDGVHPNPVGFLKAAIDVVHKNGGVFIADEVQPGFARTGDAFWGFARHGIIPDMVTTGKPMGNGIPISGLAAKHEVLAAFSDKLPYFNTFGGNPVAIAAAQAVLNVIKEEKLQEHCKVVGAKLLKALQEVKDRHPDSVGDVRGAGLFIGFELAKNDGKKTPDQQKALDAIELLRDNNVLTSVAGPYGNVLKLRPPMAFQECDIDWIASTLDKCLHQLES